LIAPTIRCSGMELCSLLKDLLTRTDPLHVCGSAILRWQSLQTAMSMQNLGLRLHGVSTWCAAWKHVWSKVLIHDVHCACATARPHSGVGTSTLCSLLPTRSGPHTFYSHLEQNLAFNTQSQPSARSQSRFYSHDFQLILKARIRLTCPTYPDSVLGPFWVARALCGKLEHATNKESTPVLPTIVKVMQA
jgi:hypothetical protein